MRHYTDLFCTEKWQIAENGKFEGTGFSHLVVNGRHMYIYEHY